tara:strand:+ start:2512 stop:3078 length:567 start_codon:yes stop_codon:yes gene_type:complete
MINIIGGKYKNKKIDVHDFNVRPTSAIKRKAIFSIIESYALKNLYEPYKNKCFIDIYAGSGAMGLEAISRGISFSYFIENNNEIYKKLSKNCREICKENNFKIYFQNANYLDNINIIHPVSAIFIDPPYNLNPFNIILENILNKKLLDNNSLIIIETKNEEKIDFSSELKMINEKNYGKAKITFLKKN